MKYSKSQRIFFSIKVFKKYSFKFNAVFRNNNRYFCINRTVAQKPVNTAADNVMVRFLQIEYNIKTRKQNYSLVMSRILIL